MDGWIFLNYVGAIKGMDRIAVIVLAKRKDFIKIQVVKVVLIVTHKHSDYIDPVH